MRRAQLLHVKAEALVQLTWEKEELDANPPSTFSLSTQAGVLEGLHNMLEENISSRALLTDGRVL